VEVLTIVPADKGKYTIERRKNDQMVTRLVAKLDNEQHFRKAAKALHVAEEDVVRLFDAFNTGAVDSITLGGKDEVEFRLRGERESDGVSCVFDAKSLGTSNAVIEWKGTDQWCALDVDFHADFVPDVQDLVAAGQRLKPAPLYWWRTKSGGLRGIYKEQDGYDADELAAVAAVAILQRFRLAKIELNSKTRTPPDGVYVQQEQVVELHPLRRLLGDYVATDDEYARYLEDRGFVVGGRYTHDSCPIRPSSKRGQSNSPPVVVHGDHIFCFICQADGIRAGRGAGYFSASRLCGSERQSGLARMVKKLCHFEHARHALHDLPVCCHRPLYSAALKFTHSVDEPRVKTAMVAGQNLIRLDGGWADRAGVPVSWNNDKGLSRLKALPVTHYYVMGEQKINQEVLSWLTHSGNISQYGYPAINLLRGARLTEFLTLPGDRLHSLVPSSLPDDRQARYIGKSDRMDLDVAWGQLELLFPKLNRNAILLYVAAKGCTESPAGLPPFIFAHGPTGASKTSTTLIASEICGDKATSIPFATSTERIRQSIIEGKTRGSFALFDEFLKGATNAGKSPVGAMEMLLNFTPDSVSHVMYAGPRALGTLPVCVWSDTDIPTEVQQHSQLARRITGVRFDEECEWERTIQPIGEITQLRSLCTPEQIAACNSILSNVMDRWFMESPPVFRDIAAELGYKSLREDGAAKEKEALIARFYAAVCLAEDMPNLDGRGWKMVNMVQETELTQLWRLLHSPGDPSTSRAINEVDLKKLLRKNSVLRLDSRQYGNKIAIRFRSGDMVNQEIV